MALCPAIIESTKICNVINELKSTNNVTMIEETENDSIEYSDESEVLPGLPITRLYPILPDYPPILQCIQCGKKIKTMQNMQIHLNKYGSIHNEECSQCSEKMTSFESYQNHVKAAHNGVWQYKCSFCEIMFNDNRDYLKHFKVHKAEKKQQKCEICGKFYTTSVNLEQHKLRIHGVNKPRVDRDPNTMIQCEICGKSFKRKYIKKHKDFVHEKVKKKNNNLSGFCEVCGNHFNNIYNHRIRNHTKAENPLTCKTCGKTVGNKFLLQDHEKTHVKIPCTLCGLMVRSVIMKRHIAHKHMKDSEKPHQCKICNKGFVTNQSFKEHQNIHTGEKPFKCKFCDAKFASAGTKAGHQRTHLGIKRKT